MEAFSFPLHLMLNLILCSFRHQRIKNSDARPWEALSLEY